MTQIPKGAVELQPCPFCGSRELRFSDSDIDGWISHVECMDCDDMLGPMSEFKYEDVEEARADASNVWNRRAALSPLPIAGGGKEGWQLVPVKPTDEMLAAIWSVKASNGRNIAEVCYEAMLTASPVPPSSPGKDGGQEVEAVANLVYEAMRVAAHAHDPGRPTPEWVDRGNSLMQDEARRVARSIASPSPQSTVDADAVIERLTNALTKLEREASEVSKIGAKPGAQWTRLAGALINARAALAEAKGSGQ